MKEEFNWFKFFIGILAGLITIFFYLLWSGLAGENRALQYKLDRCESYLEDAETMIPQEHWKRWEHLKEHNEYGAGIVGP